MSTRIPFRPFRHAWWAVPITLVVAVLLGLVGRALWTPKPVVEEPIDELKPVNSGWFIPPSKPDMDAATAHNFHGVELMDQLEFTDARAEFAAAVRAAPDWLPARINYGIAVFNENPDNTIQGVNTQAKKAQQVFAGVLARDPDNKHAHYTLGMIDLYTGEYAHAYPHFLKMSELDPDDAHTWLRVGVTHPAGIDSEAAEGYYEKAIGIDPKLNEARYRLAYAIRLKDDLRFEELLSEFEKLHDSDQFTPSRILFGEMGKYADVIGRDPAKPGEYGGDPPKRRKRGWAGLDRGSKSK